MMLTKRIYLECSKFIANLALQIANLRREIKIHCKFSISNLRREIWRPIKEMNLRNDCLISR